MKSVIVILIVGIVGYAALGPIGGSIVTGLAVMIAVSTQQKQGGNPTKGA